MGGPFSIDTLRVDIAFNGSDIRQATGRLGDRLRAVLGNLGRAGPDPASAGQLVTFTDTITELLTTATGEGETIGYLQVATN